MKGSSEVVEEISLSSPPESKESYIKQRTRAKFQQLIKSSSQLSSQQSSESTEQVEESPLLLKLANQRSIERDDLIDGSANMGFSYEDDKVTTSLQVSPDPEDFSKQEPSSSYFVRPIPRQRQSKSQQKDKAFSLEQSLTKPQPASRAKPFAHNSSDFPTTKHLGPTNYLVESELSALSLNSKVQTSYDGDLLQKGDSPDLQNTNLTSRSTHGNQTAAGLLKSTEETHGNVLYQDASADPLEATPFCGTKMNTKELHQKRITSTVKIHKKKVLAEHSPETPSLDTGNASKGVISCSDDLSESEKVLGIFIHHCDRLRIELMVSHPVVRVHIIDAQKGTYLKKSNAERAVTSFYEAQRSDVDFIMPVMTQPSTYIEKKLPYPSWEELLVFNENFRYLIQGEVNVILFFEVLDFFKALSGGKKYHRLHNQSGWQKIAWAFLKLVGSNNIVNTGKKLRLQLYKVPSVKKNARASTTTEVYDWWSKKHKTPLQSSLYVSVEPIDLVEVEPAIRSMLPMQAEKGRTTFDELTKTLDSGTAATSPKSTSSCSDPLSSETSLSYQWTRLPEQPCEIPNIQLHFLSTKNCPCFSIKISHNGRYLAAGCGAKEQHSLIIFEVPSGNILCQQITHTGIIYDLEWFLDDKWLLTASADCTVRLWNASSWNCLAVLPHPSFVYCARFQLPFFTAVATGSYDHVVRFWLVTSDGNVHLLREFEGHHSHINTLCFDHTGSMLFSADNLGEIKIWNTEHYGKMPSKEICQRWDLERECGPQELKGIPINSINLVNDEKMLLLFCRDSVVRLFDFTKKKVVQRYSGSVNCQNLLRGSLSPCGNLVFQGGEDGRVHVWDLHSGTVIAVYSSLPYTEPVLCVDYHPHDHIVAMCSLEASMPILIYKYDETAPLVQETAQVRRETSSSTKVKTSGSNSNYGDMYSMSETSPFGKVLPSDHESKYSFPKSRDSGKEENYNSSLSEISSQLKSPVQRNQRLIPGIKFTSPTVENTSSTSWGSTSNSTSTEYIALCDYKPQRADEIALKKGDKVSVIKFETDSWWIGSAENGRQGYFPSSYVVSRDGRNVEVCGTDDDVYEDTPQALTAVITASGKFEIISGPEESDELLHLSPRKKRLARKKKGILDDHNQTQPPVSQNPKRHRRRHLLKSMQEPR